MSRGMISKQFVEELKDRLALSDVFTRLGINVKKSGNNFVCLSPFRNEKTASLHINNNKGTWVDYGDTDHAGDHISIIEQHLNYQFHEAVEFLAGMAGMEVVYEQKQGESANRKYQFSMDEFYNVNSIIANTYHQELIKQPEAKHYAMQERGLNADTIQRFQIGFAPDNFGYIRDQVHRSMHPILKKLDILLTSDKNNNQTVYDKFRGRLMFPIRDHRGRTMGFGGRVMQKEHEGGKYINSAETPVFKKGKLLFGLYESLSVNRNPEYLTFVEGYMDVAMMHQYGINNVVAANGTALTPEQVELAFRFTERVVFCFDGDKAGLQAAAKAMDIALPKINDGKTISFVFLPKGQDPDSILKSGLKDELIDELNKGGMSLSDFAVWRVQGRLDPKNDGDLSKIVKNAIELLQKMPEGLYLDATAAKISQTLGLPTERVLMRIDEAKKKAMSTAKNMQAADSQAANSSAQPQKRAPSRPSM